MTTIGFSLQFASLLDTWRSGTPCTFPPPLWKSAFFWNAYCRYTCRVHWNSLVVNYIYLLNFKGLFVKGKAHTSLFDVVALQIYFQHHIPPSCLTGFYSIYAWQKVTCVPKCYLENPYVLRFGAINFFLCHSPSHLSLGIHFSVSLACYYPFLFCALQIFSLYFDYFWDIIPLQFLVGAPEFITTTAVTVA